MTYYKGTLTEITNVIAAQNANISFPRMCEKHSNKFAETPILCSDGKYATLKPNSICACGGVGTCEHVNEGITQASIDYYNGLFAAVE